MEKKSAWLKFWDDLNIRKFVVVVIAALYGTYMRN
jgi:hypothetical protein